MIDSISLLDFSSDKKSAEERLSEDLEKALQESDGQVKIIFCDMAREKEKEYLIHKLSAFRGRIGLTAKSCGMEVRTLHRKMQLYGLDKKAFSKRL